MGLTHLAPCIKNRARDLPNFLLAHWADLQARLCDKRILSATCKLMLHAEVRSAGYSLVQPTRGEVKTKE